MKKENGAEERVEQKTGMTETEAPAVEGVEVSSDYRGIYAEKPTVQAAEKAEKETGSAENETSNSPSGNSTGGGTRKGKSRKRNRSKNPGNQGKAGTEKDLTVQEEPKAVTEAEPEPEPDPERDDFLQEEETSTGDELLTTTPMANLDAEEIAQAARRRPRRKRKYGIFVGALVLVLALVGVGFLVTSIGTQVYRVLTDDSQLRAYDTFLTPVVMQDPEPFEDIADASGEMILTSSVWRAIMVNGTEYNEYDDLGRTIVPLVDVTDACHELFGPECEIRPEDAPTDSFYEFDEEDNTFHVTPYSSQSSFVPYTESSKKSGASTVLRVGYVSASDEWRTDASGEVQSPEPVKYMEYVLQSDAQTGMEYITAIRVG